MHWDGTITPATVISMIGVFIIIFGGLKFWFRLAVILDEYPPHRHDRDDGITYPKNMAPNRRYKERDEAR